MGCQKEIAKQIHEGGGDYVLALKDNQPLLAKAVEQHFLDAHETEAPTTEVRQHTTAEKGHGRDGKQTSEVRYFISSLEVGVKKFANAVRGHWSIENKLHWTLDVTFNEDQSRIRKDHGAENFALVRRYVLSIIKLDTSKGSMRSKRKMAAWSEDYLLSLLKNVV